MSRLILFWFLMLTSALCKPNVIVIYTDDHGWPDIGAAGIYDDLKTPHIDALAADGVRCTSGYSTAPQCVPSRGGLLAGRDQSRFGLETNGESLNGFNAEVTISERLQNAGYRTAQLGKWHLGPGPEIVDHGFDQVFNKNSARPAWTNFAEEFDDLYHIDACAEAAKKFIVESKDTPFFLYLAWRAPHVPLDAPEKYLARFPGKMPERRRQALAMISAMDDGVGVIRETLRENGLDQKTLLFFVGDNGAPLKIQKLDAPGGGPGWDGSLNAPMNGEKGMLAEGGIRVPYVVAWPGTIPGGQVYDEPVTTLDIASTAVALAKIPRPANYDGTNLIPHLTGEVTGSPHDQLFWRWSTQSAIREGRWKFLRGGDREYLFDLDQDPGELTNRASEFPEIAARLRADLSDWAGELDPPGLLGNEMPETWERYFDHYLDGKAVEISEEKPPTIQGWITRNATSKLTSDGMKIVSPTTEGRLKELRPFITQSGLHLKGGSTLAVDIQAKGEVSISWRFKGENDFVKENQLVKPIEDNRCIFRLPEEEIIHLRVGVPSGGVIVKEINIEQGPQWKFQ